MHTECYRLSAEGVGEVPAPRAERSSSRPSRAPPLRAVLAAVAVVVAVTATGLGPSPGARAAAALAPPTLQPILYDLTVAYNPGTCEMTVTCVLEARVARDPPATDGFAGRTGYYRLGLWRDYRVDRAECDGTRALVRSSRSGTFWLVEVPQSGQSSEVGLVKRWTVTYHGTPDRYDEEQDRYWSRGTEEALWLCWGWHWVPVEANVWITDDYWFGSRFRVAVSVPADWEVLSVDAPQVKEVEGGLATYRFETRAGSRETYPPCVLVAGPYRSLSGRTATGVSYTVWGLPRWENTARDLFEEMEPLLAYFEEVVGRLPLGQVTIAQVPPEQGGGVAWPGHGFLVVAAEGQRYMFGDEGDPRDLWAHELGHIAAPNFDDGLVDYLALDYLRRREPEIFQRALTSRAGYFLRAVAEHGDRAILPALTARAFGEHVPEVHAFLYTKPALVWNMFRNLFGEEAAYSILKRFHEELPLRHLADYEDWYLILRRLAEDVSGEDAARFLDHWYRQAQPLDLAVESARCRRAGPGDAGDAGDADEWVLSFVLRDEGAEGARPAREAVPEVDVVITMDGEGEAAEIIERVRLTGNRTRVELTCPARPVSVRLDSWILDYDPSDNYARLSETGPGDGLLSAAGIGAVLAAAAVVAVLLRRRPVRLRHPPMAGRAR